MDLKEWIFDNIVDYNNMIKTEEDVKNKIVIPFLKELGYADDEMEYEVSISVQIGTKKISNIRADIVINIEGNAQLIIDTKGPKVTLSEKEVLQCISYAKLISTPPAVYAVTVNGLDCVVTNVYTGKRASIIPTKNQLIIDVNKTRKKELSTI